MREIDAGHEYELDVFDKKTSTSLKQFITFMKRDGEGYPGNVGYYPGTNCQEVLRVLIARVKYLNNQIPCIANDDIIEHLREALSLFEDRAAVRHGRLPQTYVNHIENEASCKTCGHIHCKDHL